MTPTVEKKNYRIEAFKGRGRYEVVLNDLPSLEACYEQVASVRQRHPDAKLRFVHGSPKKKPRSRN